MKDLVAENVAENYASIFLDHYFGNDVFIGSVIEQLLSQFATVIYSDVADPQYFGASFTYKNLSFIDINTYQPVRVRFYSAAHELWHLLEKSGRIQEEDPKDAETIAQSDFNQERAADHFAAALMLPQKLVIDAWKKFTNSEETSEEDIRKAVIKISDLSSSTYESVARRITELKLSNNRKIANYLEDDWIQFREQMGISPSNLDSPTNFSKFTALSSEVEKKVTKKQLTFNEASDLLRYADPKEAQKYSDKYAELLNEVQGTANDDS